MNQKLSNHLKALSFWAILLVLVIHANNTKLVVGLFNVVTPNNISYWVQSFFSQGIAAVAVPIFFGIAGYLFFFSFKPTIKDYTRKVKTRFRTLVIPYLFWSLLGFLLIFTLQSIPALKNLYNQKPIIHFPLIEIFDTILLHPIPYQFWFVLHLCILIIFIPIIYIALHYLGGWFIVIVALFWFSNLNLPYFLSESFLFFTIGAYFGKHKIQSHTDVKKGYTWLVTISWLVIVTLKTILASKGFSTHVIVGLIHKISVIIGIISCWLLLNELAKHKNLNMYKWFTLTPYTFFIFASHEPFLTLIKKVLLIVLTNQSWAQLFVFFIAPIITLMFTLIVGYLLKKRHPILYYWINGGR